MASKGKGKGKGRARVDMTLYAHALPITIEPVKPTSFFSLARFFNMVEITNPQCVGIFDSGTRSVWIVNKRDTDILWQRGFFGKGNLSRSEPSWLKRRLNEIETERGTRKGPTAEEITAQRREERKRFKAERERAMAAAAAEAEALFQAQGKAPEAPAEHISTAVRARLAAEKQAAAQAAATSTLPSTSVQVDENKAHVDALFEDDPPEAGPSNVGIEEVLEEEPLPDIEDVEHLQLTLQEAFFLCWCVNCLSILDPKTDTYLSYQELWDACLLSSSSLPVSPLLNAPPSPELQLNIHKRFDNPFLVHYVAYHFFRSLGWVVKSGIKFCVDYLLYKRGPVFSHAEFSVVVIPVYEDPEDEKTSPWDLPNVKPWTWSWLSTINRVNTQVQKSLVLLYVTIPAMSRLPLSRLEEPDVVKEYAVRDVMVKRFVPARMRD